MLFTVDKIFDVLARPADLALAAVILAILLLLFNRRGWALAILAIPALGGGALYLLPLDDWALAPLEARFPRPQALPPCIRGVLMLGSGEDRRASTSWNEALLTGGFGSYLEAARIVRGHPEAEIIFSGYGADPHPMVTEAAIAKAVLIELGVDGRRIRLEQRSRDTWQNMVYSKAIANPGPGDAWVLVAPAFHIPRSIGIARHLGWELIADPTDYMSVPPAPSVAPSEFIRKIHDLGTALHEWEGLLGYRLEGRIDSLFPAPEIPLKKQEPAGPAGFLTCLSVGGSDQRQRTSR